MKDTFSRFEQIDKETLLSHVERIGDAYLDNPRDGNHNDSPTMQDFLDLHSDHEETMTFTGYIVSLPRPDYRVTVDQINFNGLDKDQIVELMETYCRSASDWDVDTQEGTLWFWWD